MRKLFYFLIIFILNTLFSFAQKNERKNIVEKQDETVMSVTYECFYQKVLEVKKQEKDIMRLDIGRHSSQFVSPILEWVKKNKYVPGSPNSRRHPYQNYDGTLRFEVFKNTPKQGYQYFIHDPGLIATRDKTEGLFTWELLKGDSIVSHYPCKKARTTFRGRTWTVWYTLDLPYSDGPWKFCGLPGLILYAWESEGYLRFKCIGIEKGDGHEIKLRTPKSGILDVYSHERAAELMMLEQWDMFKFLETITPSDFTNVQVTQIKTPDGKVYRPGEMKPQTAILYEKFPGVNVKKKYPKKKSVKKK